MRCESCGKHGMEVLEPGKQWLCDCGAILTKKDGVEWWV